MKEKTIQGLEEKYDLGLEEIAEKLKKEKPKKVLLQFPDGFKPYATEIQKKLESMLGGENVRPEFFIWFDSCFGACDLPLETEKLGINMLVQFGHSPWKFESKDIKFI